MVGQQCVNAFKRFMRLFTIVLPLGVLFVLGPAKLPGNLIPLSVVALFYRRLSPDHPPAHRQNIDPLFGAGLILMPSVSPPP